MLARGTSPCMVSTVRFGGECVWWNMRGESVYVALKPATGVGGAGSW